MHCVVSKFMCLIVMCQQTYVIFLNQVLRIIEIMQVFIHNVCI